MKSIIRVLGLVSFAVLALPLVAAAGPYTGDEVTVSDPNPSPGSSVDVAASGFQPNSDVDILFRSTPTLLASVTADAGGDVAATVTIPSDASGEHRIELVGVAPDGSARTVSATVTVSADGSTSSGSLPSTGNSTVPIVYIAILVALLGVALLIGARVRSRARSA